MNIKELNHKSFTAENIKLEKAFTVFNKLIAELKKKALTTNVTEQINLAIDIVNSPTTNDKQIKKQTSKVVKIVEKEMKIVPKGYYRNIWFVLGMTVFGLPLGVVFGMLLKNMAFLGIGLPIGMPIGIAVGTFMDKKAFEEGRQLDLEI